MSDWKSYKDSAAVDIDHVFPELSAQISLFIPSLQSITAERFGSETRQAQNLSMLLASLGIAGQAGLIALEKASIETVGVKVGVNSVDAGVLLLAVASIFFLVRFLFLSWRDSYAYRLRIFVAAKDINDLVQKFPNVAIELQRQAEELEKLILAGDCSAETRARLNAIEERILHVGLSLGAINGIVSKFQASARFIDRYTRLFEVSLPCLLVGVLVGWKFGSYLRIV